jgi:hypothetical protein
MYVHYELQEQRLGMADLEHACMKANLAQENQEYLRSISR